MKIPVYEQCCCVFSLETGCKIIGIVQAILSLIMLIFKSIVIHDRIQQNPFVREEEHVPPGFLVTTGVVTILISLVQIPLGILLFYSVGKKNTRIPKIWVCVSTTLVSASFVLLAVMAAWVSSYTGEGGSGFANFFMGVLLLCPAVYIVNVVYSYHRSLNDSPASDQQASQNLSPYNNYYS